MSTKEEYAIITKNIFIEERVHNWIVTTLKTRLQDECTKYNKRMGALKQKRDRLEAELIGLGDLPIFKDKPQNPNQIQKKFTKSEALIDELEEEIKACYN